MHRSRRFHHHSGSEDTPAHAANRRVRVEQNRPCLYPGVCKCNGVVCGGNRPIFYWTDNGTTHRCPMNPTVKKKINLQVFQQQLKIHTGSTANFETREDSSRDLLGKFHKDRSVWIRARRRVLQCLFYQFPCVLQLK